jgi:cell division protein FtsL
MIWIILIVAFIIVDLYVRIHNMNKSIVQIAKIVDAKAKDHEERIQELENSD